MLINGKAADLSSRQFRRAVLFHLGSDLRQELEFCASIAADTPKNYQLWYVGLLSCLRVPSISSSLLRHHRRAIVERLQDASEELPHTGIVLMEDAKNYHAWSHR